MILVLKDEGSHTICWMLKAFSVGAIPTMDLGKSSCPGRQIWAMTPKRKYKGSVAQFVSLCLQIPEGRERISGEVKML